MLNKLYSERDLLTKDAICAIILPGYRGIDIQPEWEPEAV